MKPISNIKIAIICFIAVMGCMLLIACTKPAQSSEQSSNPDINVETVLVKDGIKVYRFFDGARYIYYTDARGATSFTQTEGKTQVPVRVETVR